MDVIAHFKGARNVMSVPAGLILFHEGDPATEMYVVLQGSVEISIGGEVVEVAGAGTMVGEMALVDAGVRSATVVTRSECRFVPVDRRQFDLLVRESPEFARQVMAVMVERLRRTNERLREAATELAVRGRRPRAA